MTRPDQLQGRTHKVKAVLPDGEEVSLFVTVNKSLRTNVEDVPVANGFACRVTENVPMPFEVFVNVRNAKLWEHLTVTTVLMSRLLQAGVSAETIAEDLNRIHSPVTGHMQSGQGWVPSLYARIGAILLEEART